MAQYIIPMARNTVTGQTVKQQDLSGSRFQPHQRPVCQQVADILAANMSKRTGQLWAGYCQQYSA